MKRVHHRIAVHGNITEHKDEQHYHYRKSVAKPPVFCGVILPEAMRFFFGAAEAGSEAAPPATESSGCMPLFSPYSVL